MPKRVQALLFALLAAVSSISACGTSSEARTTGAFSHGTYIVRDDFARHRDAVADLTQGTARAIRWAQTTPGDQVVAQFKDIITRRGREGESPDKANYWKSTGVAGSGGVTREREIQLWID